MDQKEFEVEVMLLGFTYNGWKEGDNRHYVFEVKDGSKKVVVVYYDPGRGMELRMWTRNEPSFYVSSIPVAMRQTIKHLKKIRNGQ